MPPLFVSWISMYFFIPIPIVNINCVYYCYRDNQCIGFILPSILMRLLLVSWKQMYFFFSFADEPTLYEIWTCFSYRDTLVFIQYHHQLSPFVSRGLMQMSFATLYGFLCWCFSLMGMQLLTKIWFQIFFWFIKNRVSSAIIRYSIVVV